MEVKDLATSDNAQNLNQLVALLDLFNHRNNNQHRRSLWWRQFSTLRRQLRRLTADLNSLIVQPESHVERVRLRARRHETEVRLTQRINFWQDVLAPKWHRAFSQLAAVGRFAHLGLVLLAVLADICRVIGIIAQLEEQVAGEMQEVLLAFGHEQWQPRKAAQATSNATKDEQALAEDFGIAVSRDLQSSAQQHQRKGDKPVSKIKKAKKPKRSTGNAIDDLFGSI